jgi:5-methylcytosine-specific restriction endonuclease McrA
MVEMTQALSLEAGAWIRPLIEREHLLRLRRAHAKGIRPTAGPSVGFCLQCGKPFHIGRKTRFCSMDCCQRASSEAARCRKRAAKGARVCLGCEGEIRGKAKFCQSCSVKRRRERQALWPSRQRVARQPRRRMVSCPRCGSEFWPWANGSHARKFCCKAAPKPPTPKARRAPAPRECLWCRELFIGVNSRQVACSTVCRQRYESKRRKLRLKGLNPTVVPVAQLYRRDSGMCGICKAPVDRTLRYPHPMSATIDHIVPISKGGQHESHNLQLAHSRCNISKGNREVGGGGWLSFPSELFIERVSAAQEPSSSRLAHGSAEGGR